MAGSLFLKYLKILAQRPAGHCGEMSNFGVEVFSGIDRQSYCKLCATFATIAPPQASTGCYGQPLNDGQAQTGSLLLRGKERLPDTFFRGPWNTWTIVRHRHIHMPFGFGMGHRDRLDANGHSTLARIKGFKGILHKVDQHLLHLARIRGHRGNARFTMEIYL